MKTFKVSIALLLVVALFVTLFAACANKETPSNDVPNTNNNAPSSNTDTTPDKTPDTNTNSDSNVEDSSMQSNNTFVLGSRQRYIYGWF